jgi:hypothetical protein
VQRVERPDDGSRCKGLRLTEERLGCHGNPYGDAEADQTMIPHVSHPLPMAKKTMERQPLKLSGKTRSLWLRAAA